MRRRGSTISRKSKATERAQAPALERPPTPFVPPYAPSWFDRYSDWLDRRLKRSWILHLGLAVFLALVLTGSQWVVGGLPFGRFDMFHFALAAAGPLILEGMRYLKWHAADALERFRPALCKPVPFSSLRYRLTTMPARGAIAAGFITMVVILFIGAGVSALFPNSVPSPGPASTWLPTFLDAMHFSNQPVSAFLVVVLAFPGWWTLGTLIYQIFHQLRTIDQIYRQHTDVNLFLSDRMHAFSSHTSRVGIAIILLANLNFVAPEFRGNLGIIVVGEAFSLLGVAAFILPLAGIHRLLVLEKERLLSENSARIQSTVVRLHHALQAKTLRGMDEFEKALSSLDREHAVLSRIPTWPWQPGMVRGVVAALLLPLVIWLIQQILQPLLAR